MTTEGDVGWKRMNKAPTEKFSTDGIVRSKLDEKRLNLLAADVFKHKGGVAFLDYLREITINSICGPHVSKEELYYIEGQRALVAVIEQRVQLGKDKKP